MDRRRDILATKTMTLSFSVCLYTLYACTLCTHYTRKERGRERTVHSAVIFRKDKTKSFTALRKSKASQLFAVLIGWYMLKRPGASKDCQLHLIHTACCLVKPGATGAHGLEEPKSQQKRRSHTHRHTHTHTETETDRQKYRQTQTNRVVDRQTDRI